MKKIKLVKLIVVFAIPLALAACSGQKTLYDWNGYNYALLKHYKDGTGPDLLAEDLQEIIEKAEEKNAVPPGLYAEFGYALLDSGSHETALLYFKKEKDAWPESAFFMDNIIRRISE